MIAREACCDGMTAVKGFDCPAYFAVAFRARQCAPRRMQRGCNLRCAARVLSPATSRPETQSHRTLWWRAGICVGRAIVQRARFVARSGMLPRAWLPCATVAWHRVRSRSKISIRIKELRRLSANGGCNPTWSHRSIIYYTSPSFFG